MDFEVKDVERYGGAGGVLLSFLSRGELAEGHQVFGQVYCSIIEKGVIRANHFHRSKEEWLMLVQGRLRLVLEDTVTTEKQEILLDASAGFKKIRIGRLVAHAVECLSDEKAILLEYSGEPFNPESEDKHSYEVLKK